MAFYQKYRPKNFSDLIGEDHIANTLLEAAKSNRLSHAYLLTGPRGTGKTTTARLLAKVFNCSMLKEGEPCNECSFCTEISAGRAVDVIEIDAASHTKVDEIREIIDSTVIAPTTAKKKIYIVDEVHMLSNSSFNALLKTLEEPPKHVVFILATTEVHKLPVTILSRTQRYDFKRISKNDLIKNLKKIAQAEKILIEEDALNLIAINAEGVHRDAVGLLEQMTAVTQKIKKEDVQNILGIAEEGEVYSFLGAIFDVNTEEGLKIAHCLYDDGADMARFNFEVVEILRKILLYQLAEKPLFEDTDENLKKIDELAKKIESGKTLKIVEIFITTGHLIKSFPNPLLAIEMAVVEASSLIKSLENRDQIIESKNQKSKPPPTGHPEPIIKPLEQEKKNDIEDSGLNKDDVAKISDINTVPVPIFQMTDDLWQKIVKATQKKNSALGALLRDAKPTEVSEERILLSVKFKFHKERISEPKNCKLLEEAISEVTGAKNCLITCEIANIKQKPETVLKNEEDIQLMVEEIFA